MIKVASTSSPPAGGDVTYTLTVANDGPSPATGVTVTDPLPAGLRFQSAIAGQGSCTTSGGVVSCAVGSLAPGGATLVTITAGVASTTQGQTITNTATVSANENDASRGLSSARATITPGPPTAQPDARLTITKTVNHRRANFGSKLTYTIQIANAGPATALTPMVTDTFSAAASILSVRPSSGSCHKRDPLTCTLASIAAGQRATITVVARARALGALRNTAAVSTPTPLAPGSVTLARASTTVLPGAHSHIVLHDTSAPPRIPSGGTSAYRPKVSNPNPWVLRHVKVCDRLPRGVIFVDGSSGIRRKGSRVCWTISTLPSHGSRTVWVQVGPLLGVAGSVRDAATATADAQGRRMSARASARVLVIPSNLCGLAVDREHTLSHRAPVAVIAC